MQYSKMREIGTFWRKKPALVALLLVELIYLTLNVLAAMQPTISYTFEPGELEQMSQDVEFSYDENGFYGVTYDIDWTEILRTPALSLRPGRYNVTVEYQYRPTKNADGLTHHSCIQIQDDTNGYAVEEGSMVLAPDKMLDTVTVSVRQATDSAHIVFVDDGGTFTIGNVTITQNGIYTAFCVFLGFLGCLLLNGALLLLLPSSPVYAGRTTVTVFFVLGGAVVLASAPSLMQGVNLGADDCPFHLNRIEGIVEGLRNGQFPVRVNTMAKNGYGYSTSLFYGELFLYFPAILRLLGATIQQAWNTFIIGFHILTAVISYRSFKPIFGQRIALVGAVLYLLSPYRLHRIYRSAALGEYLAVTFLPAIVYGLWLLYCHTDDAKARRRGGLILALGYSALLQCHMINTEIAVLAGAVFCLLLWRKTLRPTVLFTWLKACALAILLNLWFLVPFLTVATNKLYIGYEPLNIQSSGQSIMALFNNNDAFAIGPGVLLYGALAVLLLCAIKEIARPWRIIAGISLWFGAMGVWMSTEHFPWNTIAQIPGISILTVIQFPWRYNTLATIGLIVALLAAMAGLAQTRFAHWNKAMMLTCMGIAVCGVLSYWGYWIPQMQSVSIIDTSQLAYSGNSNIAYRMDDLYQPKPITVTQDGYVPSQQVTSTTLGDFIQEKGVTTVEYHEYLGQEGYVEFPLFYYPVYALVQGEGTVIPTVNGLVGVVVPANSSGTLSIAYREPLRWRLADLISAGTLLALAGWKFFRICRRKVADRGKECGPGGLEFCRALLENQSLHR